jgi:hypothetical protein
MEASYWATDGKFLRIALQAKVCPPRVVFENQHRHLAFSNQPNPTSLRSSADQTPKTRNKAEIETDWSAEKRKKGFDVQSTAQLNGRWACVSTKALCGWG